MKQWKRITVLLLAVSMCFSLFACWGKGNGATEPPAATGGADESGTVTHAVRLVSEGGMAFEGVGVYIYEDNTLAELVWFAKTDTEGRMTFDAPVQEGYVAVLDKVPEGYELEATYALTGTETEIVLKAALVSEYAGKTFQLGDVMCDLTITDVNGKTHQLSQLLEEKDAVMLNFWFLTCTPCRQEFPFLQEAYAEYSDKVEVLALNPIDADEQAIRDYVKEMKLTMPFAACDAELEKAMKVISYPTTIMIDRYGVISLVHTGSITSAQTFKDIFAHFTAEDYQQGVVKDMEDILTSDPEEDEEKIENPTEVSGVSSFKLTVRAGEVVYCDLYRMTNMYMQIKSPNAYLIYNGKTYYPNGGTIGLMVSTKDPRTPAPIGLGNTGDKTETFTITLSQLAGSLNNPYAMSLGEFSVSIPAGKEEGVYYRYVAEKDGYLSVSCLSASAGVPYGYTLYNLNSYANRNLESDAAVDENGYPVVRIQVKKGQTVQFNPSALPDNSGNYPAIQMKFLAQMLEGIDDGNEEQVEKLVYGLTITDEFRQPIPGVHVALTQVLKAEEAAEGKTPLEQSLTSNEKGNAAAELPKGTYQAVVKLPVGYLANTTEVLLTEQNPTLAIKLDVDESLIQIPYTVTVKDEDGAAISGVLVSMGSKTGYTDDSGKTVITLPKSKDGYTAVIAIPEGYTAESMSYEIPAGTTSLEVVLKKGSSGEKPDENSQNYTVTVVDYYGTPMEGVSVTFLKDGSVMGLKTTDAEGNALISLEKGSYTVSLAFSGSYYCDASNVTLTEADPTATLTAVAKRGSDYTSLYVGDAFHLNLGATYVENMQANAVNYFIFKPTVSGVYRFTTSDPAAVISYWGANDAYIADQTRVTDYKDNVFTREIREDQTNNTIVILGITGAENCVVEITRTGDIQLSDEEKAEFIIFEGTQTPAPGTVYRPAESGTLTYVDIKAATSDYKLVKGSDGFYHLGAANGPLMYVNLGPGGRYVTFYQMMGFEQAGGTFMRKYFYDENGKFIKKEEYTECLKAYTGAVDVNGYGIYPLTDDLVYILQNGGENKEWWDETSPNYLFTSLGSVNTEIAWMFNCCYFK